MKSIRLPLKPLRIIEDKPMIEHMIDRLKLAELPSEIILCTSTSPQDDVLIDIAEKNGIRHFRDSELDVLERLKNAAEHYKIDLIASTTGDNPFTDPHFIDKLVEYHMERGLDYSATRGLPLGVNSHVVTLNALKKACDLKEEERTEIWGDYFVDTGRFTIGFLEVKDEELRHPEIRMTVDTPTDLRFMREIFRRLYKPGKIIDLRKVMRLLKRNPELCAINEQIQQKRTPDYISKDVKRLKENWKQE